MAQPMQQQTNTRAEAIFRYKVEAVLAFKGGLSVEMDDLAFTNGRMAELNAWRTKQYTAEQCLKNLGSPISQDFYYSSEAANIIKEQA